MDAEERQRILLSRGYFPKELPLVFTTEDFGKFSSEIVTDWKAANVFSEVRNLKIPRSNKKKSGSYSYKLASTEMETISMPKKGYERRNIHITHPIPQAVLSSEISANWKTISQWVGRSKYTLDKISISNGNFRGIKGLNFEAHRAKKALIEANADWLVRTDIARFYPSIYTHSIPWAAYGKDKVKKQIKMYEGSLADRLDAILKSCNRNQTVGIPIGPETSRIVAEIISAQVDQQFSAATSNLRASNADRLQDDWFIGIESLERAEGVLSAVIGSYREYGLDINGSKTAIERAFAPLDNTWVSEIRAFLSHRSGKIRGARLRELLALTLKLQLEHPKEAIVGYTLSVIESQPALVRDVSALESFLMRAALIAPLAMNRICQVMINLNFDTKRVSLDRVGERFATLAERAITNGHLYEAIWLVYTMRGLNIPLKSKVFSEIIETTQSSALALILLDMKNRGLFPRKLPVQEWELDCTLDRVQTDWSWLLSYEGIRHGWLADPHKLMNKPFFQAMQSRDVVFYDPKRNVRRTEKVVQLRRNQQKKNKLITFRMIDEMRGFAFGDDYD